MTRTELETRLRDAARMFDQVMARKLSPSVLENLFVQTIGELDANPLRVVETGKEHAA